MPRKPSPLSIDSKISRRIERSPKGIVFTPAKFASMGSRDAINKSLLRLTAAGKIRRLSRGLYDKPRQDELIGELWPAAQAVINALQQQHGLRLQPTGLYAANILGLSEQVPAKIELLADIGKSRLVKAGPMRISLIATAPRNLAAAVKSPDVIKRLSDETQLIGSTPDQFAHHINTETERWRKLVKEANISLN